MYDASKKYCITIPRPWSVSELMADESKTIVFSLFVKKTEDGLKIPVPVKSVTVSVGKTLRYFVYGRIIDVRECKLAEILDDIKLLPQILIEFQNRSICNGIDTINVKYLPGHNMFKDYMDKWRSNNCALISNKKNCDNCIKIRKSIRKAEIRFKTSVKLNYTHQASIHQRKTIALRNKNRRERRQKNRAQQRVQLLEQSLRDKTDEISLIHAEMLDAQCSRLNIPAAQKNTLKEIIAAASTKDVKNRRYSEEWIMLCLLMNIRSPGYYEFLRKNDVLPLPCTRTIRRYLSVINMKCGFDEGFANLLEKHFDAKTPLQRHGVLLLDEINLRKSVSVCSKNLTYVGLTDFGNDGPQSTNIEDQATHGLVFMFQPLADSYTQPIAVFASKNPVKGNELAKLVIKAIVYLEKTGAKIHGVIADGAATNAKMWSVLGVSGSKDDIKTWFTHPVDDERQVFVFSDIPHVLKNIRNRLFNKEKLRVSSNFLIFIN